MPHTPAAHTARSSRHHHSAWLASAALCCGLLLGAFLYTPGMMHLDFLWLDRLTQWRANDQAGDPGIIVVDIDDYSLQAMAPVFGRWPWPRATHAELVEWLAAQHVQATVFDIWFSEPDVLRPDFDEYFAEVMSKQNNLYLPTLLMNSADRSRAQRLDSYPSSLPIQRSRQALTDARANLLLPAMGKPEHWKLGLVNFAEDRDGRARHYQLVTTLDGWMFLALPTVLARDLGFTLPQPLPEDVHSWRLDWRGGDKPYTTISYADLWQQIQNGQKNPELTGKIILIGSTAAGLHDLRPTPISAQYSGLYILATAIDNLKNNQQLNHSPLLGLLLGLTILGWLWWRLQSESRMHIAAGQFALVSISLLSLSAFAVTRQWLLPALSPLLCGGLLLSVGSVLRYMEEREAHTAAIELFGRFLDPLVVEQLANQGLNEDTLAGKTCDISVLFSDIRGFTTMSEQATAAEIMSLLNAYFSQQVGVIFRHKGTLDKFIGDAIMAFWGAPLPDDNHAVHAVSAALEMVDVLLQFRDERGLQAFDVGIGIHSGPAMVGMLGSEQRLEYTAIGDTVNLGSRLEGITKGKARILVSQSTRDACGDVFDFISHGSVTVKGRAEPVNIYEPRRKSA
jgi:adenylate cyclase